MGPGLLLSVEELLTSNIAIRTNSKPNDKNCDGDQADFTGNSKICHRSLQVGSDNTTGKGNDEAGKGDHHRAVPFVELGPVLRVLGVIDRESNQFPVFHSTSHVRLDGLDDLASSCLGGVFSKVGSIVQFSDGEVEVVDWFRLGTPRDCSAGLIRVSLFWMRSVHVGVGTCWTCVYGAD